MYYYSFILKFKLLGVIITGTNVCGEKRYRMNKSKAERRIVSLCVTVCCIAAFKFQYTKVCQGGYMGNKIFSLFTTRAASCDNGEKTLPVLQR
jgi:hypothetical protein